MVVGFGPHCNLIVTFQYPRYNLFMDQAQANKTIAYWLESADYDMGVAESLLEKEKFHYALFFGHLCLEKLLKALYVKTTSDHAPVTHSLPLLA